nr:bacillithiol biosynthesis BshC [Cytophagales bacterium]
VYWFQLTPVFAFYQVDYPAVMPRNFSLILPKAVARKVTKLGLSEEDLFKPFDDLRISYATSNAAQDISLGSERERLEELMGLIATKAERYEPSLVYATNAAKVRGLKILEQLATKFRKAEEVKQHLAIRQLKEIKEALFPGGVPQERKVNFLNFYLDDPHFIGQLLMELDPLDFKVIILTPDAH